MAFIGLEHDGHQNSVKHADGWQDQAPWLGVQSLRHGGHYVY